MSDDLAKIAFVRELSSRAVSTIRQNIVVSLVNVAFMVVMALLGYLGLVTGLLLNEASALFVIANALRLLKWQSTGTAVPVVAEMTASALVKSGVNEQVAQVGSCCCAGVEAATKTPIPIFPMAAPQGLCCSGGNADDAVSTSPPIINETKEAGGLDSMTFRIDGAGCSCEGQIVEKRVKALKGVKTFSLNPITNQMKLTYDPSALSVQDIQTAVKKAGATAVLVGSKADVDQARSRPAPCCDGVKTPTRGGGCCG